MTGVDPLNTSLYFSAAAGAAQQAAEEIKKKEKAQETKRLSFAAVLKRNTEAEELAEAGFPPEIADMSVEDAAVFLKDRMDSAGDKLSGQMTTEAFAEYRK